MNNKKLVTLALFVTTALMLSYVESLIPFFFGVPGMKLGLANLAVVIALYFYGWREALVVNVLRIVLAGFLVVLPRQMILRYRNRIINIHPSLIPSFCGTGYYGLKVHEAALARGVKITGATVHFVDEGTDTGPIILQRAVAIEEKDTPEVLQRRVMEEAEWILLPEAVRLLSEGRVSVVDGKVIIE